MPSIEKEKSIADAVLERLEIIDPTCILAGGAPRDWWLGKTANDLDFYMYAGNRTMTSIENALKYLGLPVTPLRLKGHNVRAKLDDMYGCMPNLQAVYETTYRGKSVQIMLMSEPTFRGVVDQFACSISKVWYKGGMIRPEPAAVYSRDSKGIIVEKGYTPNTAYVQKMMERFPNYRFFFQMDGDKRVSFLGDDPLGQGIGKVFTVNVRHEW